MAWNPVIQSAAAAIEEGAPILKQESGVSYHKFSELDERVQSVAMDAIASINKATSTTPGVTWEKYTARLINQLKECPNFKNTAFFAKNVDEIIGYVAFFTRKDENPAFNEFLQNDEQAYCALTAVDDRFRGKGIAIDLKMQIFNPEHRISSFSGHIKESNKASLRVLEKFAEMGFSISKEKKESDNKEKESEYFYSVSKPE